MAEFDPKSWDWWKAARAARDAGKPETIGSPALPIREQPMTGIYRMRSYRDGPFIPIQFWYGPDGTLIAERNGPGESKRIDSTTAYGAWGFAASNPISSQQYKDWQATGKWWDEDVVVVNGEQQSSHATPAKVTKPKPAPARRNKDAVIEINAPANGPEAMREAVAQPVEVPTTPAVAARPQPDWGDDEDDEGPAVGATTTPSQSEKPSDEASPVAASMPQQGAVGAPLVSTGPLTEVSQEELRRRADDERRSIGGNQQPDEFATLTDEINEWTRVARDLAKKGEPQDEATATRIADAKSKLGDLSRKANEMRKEEKRPHDEAGKAVQAKYTPLIERADVAAAEMGRTLQPFLKKREAEEKERQRLEAEANKAAAESGERVKASRGRSTGVGNRRKVGQVRRQVAVLYDLAAAAAYFATREKPNKEFRDLVETLAQRVMVGGHEVPGARLIEEVSVR